MKNFIDTRSRLVVACVLLAFAFASQTEAESRRIEVYSVSQVFWDTQSGDTLSGIAEQLLPNNPRMQQNLMQDIIELNPSAFIDNDPNLLKAGTRLWLPGHMSQPDSKTDPRNTRVETYSWGNIKRPR